MTDELSKKRVRINEFALAPEIELIQALVAESVFDPALRNKITAQTATLVSDLRRQGATTFLQSFLGEYGLSTTEGVALMSMAEAFLRVPDAATLDDLIAEKITGSNWQSHSGQASSFLVNASTWALMLTGRLLTEAEQEGLVPAMGDLVRRMGEPVVRVAMTEAMEQLGSHFVVGTSINHALKRTENDSRYADYSFSFDMLGEAALTEQDAEHYFHAYKTALAALAEAAGDKLQKNSGISVKLSALHPRFELTQKAKSFDLLFERTNELAKLAASSNLNFNIDGEEAERMEFTLDIFAALAESQQSEDWDGLGLVVQAYTRSAHSTIDWLNGLAEKTKRKFMLRLVKGAYWDTEIKLAQVQGLESYPVFTRKPLTDVSYLCAVEKLLSSTENIFPQFATHNAHTVTAILAMAEKLGIDKTQFEFQRLYGMGEDLHEFTRENQGSLHRIYAPVGEHEDLLAYLVRRLLENGANSSFVHQLTDEDVPVENIAADPFNDVTAPTPILAPPKLYQHRRNSPGFDLSNSSQLAYLDELRNHWKEQRWHALPLLAYDYQKRRMLEIINPANNSDIVGTAHFPSSDDISNAITAAVDFAPEWSSVSIEQRAEILMRAADLYEFAFGEISALLIREAGKNMSDVIGEWREAIDFLRYYATEAQRRNDLQQRTPLGVFICIAPWNFPLSIFTGQIAAALITGNTVIAKPAEQANLIAYKATQLLHEAGVPVNALQLALGEGEIIGAMLTQDERINGVCFTGSTEVAQLINRASVNADPRLRMIAETGGINAMIVDSTALPEQTVRDIITSAFYSAGQRCSALRIVYLQADIADRFIEMLLGAMNSLTVGDPWLWQTDIGPAIDKEAQESISTYSRGRESIHTLESPEEGSFVAPTVIEVNGIEDIEREVFGPVLHVARFKVDELNSVIGAINDAQYGLTFSIHTRLTQKVDRVIEQLNIGNVYVNRNQIGAVVESQPFGGQSLSGTGPKAGGPLYLSAFTRSDVETENGEATSNTNLLQLTAAQLDQVTDDLQKGNLKEGHENLATLKKLFPDNEVLNTCEMESNRRMPGPTGERNIYQLRSVGVCLCLGPTPDNAMTQALQVLSFGGTAIMCGESSSELQQLVSQLQDEHFSISALNGKPRSDALSGCKTIDAVSFFVTDSTIEEGRRIRQALAARNGVIIRFITDLVSPADYVHEVHVCNDITSSGGNVELMSMS
ncbi:MAG: bifunctional proline dehydrogenase/L-glutamate gamma-semialdehyde dehydrogenase PutA [Pseudomonadales bacterium]|nr:bifunctional proline dehydrogenase/L-glutamate gamma-semialdehyde dehydrogenase PutA [Pseudomonadales bacterium]